MSIVHCDHCNKNIDTDYNAEHFEDCLSKSIKNNKQKIYHALYVDGEPISGPVSLKFEMDGKKYLLKACLDETLLIKQCKKEIAISKKLKKQAEKQFVITYIIIVFNIVILICYFFVMNFN